MKLNKPIRVKKTKIRKTKKPIKNRSRPRKRFDDRNQKYQNLWKKVIRAINVLVNSSFLTTAAFAQSEDYIIDNYLTHLTENSKTLN